MESKESDMVLMQEGRDNILLFYPYVPQAGINELLDTLKSRWIGQGPKVRKFEEIFGHKFARNRPAIAVGSGTDALHLSYILAGLHAGDEVITPVFTCTATNIPFLYMGVEVKFADIQQHTLNIDPGHVRELVGEKTKAIVCVHYGGLPCDMKELQEIADEYEIPIIEDAAQALGASYRGTPIGGISDFTAFSFQAIKHITTGDGGMLVLKDSTLIEKARRLRWFGIDRTAKQKGIWENDITEIGYKYQMTDIAAAIALGSLQEFDQMIEHRKRLFSIYSAGLRDIPGIRSIGDEYTDRVHAAWIYTVAAERRWELQKKLREHRIEANQVHFRNDRYRIFGGKRRNLPHMDALEDKYLVLPLHSKLGEQDVARVCEVIRSGW